MLLLSFSLFLGGLSSSMLGLREAAGPMAIAFLATLSLASGHHPFFKAYSFTLWVFTFVVASMLYPSAFGIWFGTDLKILIVPLIQIITFGMGTTLSAKDFTRVFTMPWPVFMGIFLQFTVMPILGYSIAMLMGFEREVAAGVILIGSVSGGVASNLITYLARGNVALSVTMTACSTLVSPVMTPFLMRVLAGKLVPVDFLAMMFSITNMIIVPIAAGLLANRILFSSERWASRAGNLVFISVICSVLMFIMISSPWHFSGALSEVKSGFILGLALIGVVAIVKFIIGNVLHGPKDWMGRALPIISMASICFIIAIITARSRNELLSSGMLLVLAAVLHNSMGYLLGYFGGRAAGLKEVNCRTVAIEVGMQNGGMATGIAMDVLKSTNAALAPAIFGPWMNISGSILASFWRRKAVQ